MKNLFKYAAVQWKSMLAIIVILFVQAYCDLSLPAYTSDIVNVGIQQGGIEDQIPEAISVEEMDRLLLFVPEDDQQTVLDAYDKDDSTYDTEAYVLKSSVSDNEDEIGELEDLLQGPMMLVSGFESGSDMTKQIESQIKEKSAPRRWSVKTWISLISWKCCPGTAGCHDGKDERTAERYAGQYPGTGGRQLCAQRI